ncbi:MAG: protoporphyrinogen oxidase [Actinobacteria bacterium]|nr:protoporphyrinogen oxidase [Actinomycetota bacterium]
MDVIVVGAGISGLAAAHRVRQLAPDAHVSIVEAADRVGGKLSVSAVGGIAVDEGAEAFLVRVPEGVELVKAAGLAGELVHPATTAARVVVDGAPRPLPPGTVMGVPVAADPIRELLGEDAARAVAEEPTRPGEPLHEDIAVGRLVERRLGRVFVDRLVDPLLGGVYAGRADELSLRATVPGLYAALGHTGSLVEAATAASRPHPAPPGGAAPGGPVFGSLRGGLGTLPAAVLAASGAQLHTGLPVREIHRTATGFRLVAGPVAEPTVLEADAVIVAVPAGQAAPMLRTVAPAAAVELAAIEYAGVGLVTVVLPAVELPAGSGLLVPAVERRTVKALTYFTRKWPDLIGAGSRTGAAVGAVSVLRASVGRHGEEAVLDRDDADLVRLVLADLAALTGITAAPLATRVTRWTDSLPQYAVGHVDRVRRAHQAAASVPGLALCGAAYEGVGVPACVRSGTRAAEAALAGRMTSGNDEQGESSHG